MTAIEIAEEYGKLDRLHDRLSFVASLTPAEFAMFDELRDLYGQRYMARLADEIIVDERITLYKGPFRPRPHG